MKGPARNKYKKSVLKKLLVNNNFGVLTDNDVTLDDEELDSVHGLSSSSESSEEEDLVLDSRKSQKRKRSKINNDTIEEDYERVLLDNDEPVRKKKHLLPIKAGGKLIHQTTIADERLVSPELDSNVDVSNSKSLLSCESKANQRDLSIPVSTAELLAWRENALAKCRYKIGLLSADVLENPQENVSNLKQLNEMLREYRPELTVTVKKLALVSLTEIFKDILPSYRIKHQDDPEVKLKKETARLQQFEKSLVQQYHVFLKRLEKFASIFIKKKGDNRTRNKQIFGLGLLALNSLCDLLVTHPYFNYAPNIAKVLIPYLNNPRTDIREIAASCVTRVFKEDKRGVLTLFLVRQINQFVKSRVNAVHIEVISVFLALKLKDVSLDQEKEAQIKDKKTNAKRQQLLTMSRKERKAKKRLKQLEEELMETKAEENQKARHKVLTEVTKVVFTVYFRILKNAPTSKLVCTTLEGVAKFAHAINLEFYEDLVHIVCRLMDDGELNLHQQLLCIQAVFTILSGYGEALNIDPNTFYTQLYRNMLSVHGGKTYCEMEFLLKALDLVIIKRRKRITQQRLLAYTKRTASLAMQLLHNGSLACLGLLKNILQLNNFTDVLLELDCAFGQGLYLPELEEPEHCNAASTALYELTALTRHYHPTVCKMAQHILNNVPTVGEGSLPADISKLSSIELFKVFDPTEMIFKPTIQTPISTKMKMKSHFWRNKYFEELECAIVSKNLCTDQVNVYKEVKSNVSKMSIIH